MSGKMPSAEVLDLADLVQYSNGSVVSRTLCENGISTVTLFAFDKGEALSEHTAPFDALVQVVDGKGEFTIGGKAYEVSSGQMVLMPANIPHSLKATERFKMLLTMLRK